MRNKSAPPPHRDGESATHCIESSINVANVYILECIQAAAYSPIPHAAAAAADNDAAASRAARVLL